MEDSRPPLVPWALFRDDEIVWIGMARSEADAWAVGLGWPDKEEVAHAVESGMTASRISVERV